ncbi:MAG: glutamate 5-kinase [Erysipelotrichaceae bacterium]|nr:glutamate 5-kinase [Erysipelotrichaceae bacterium]
MGSNKLIVVKIGTNSLTSKAGTLAPDKLHNIAAQVADLKDSGHSVIIVTSGAIAAGYSQLGFHERPASIAAKQASAAVGQGLLMEEYTRTFAGRNIVTAQLLLTRDDFKDQRRYKNAWAALEVLLNRGTVPIINENDTVSIAELKFGDNDRLSAQVAAMVHADLLVLATDTNGLYTADPRFDTSASLIPLVDNITLEIEKMAQGSKTPNGTGGMSTKISAAKLATKAGVPVFICHAQTKDILLKIIAGTAIGTYFPPQKGMKTKKQWMAFYASASGNIYIDQGAADALCRHGKSLLPAGVKAVSGQFSAGDIVEVFLTDGEIRLGRGIVNYNIADLSAVLGLSTAAIADQHPAIQKIEVIHHNDWVASGKEEK